MVRDDSGSVPSEAELAAARRLVAGPRPAGREFDACRAVLLDDPASPEAFAAACMLLEGALADPGLPIDDTRAVVRLLRALARGQVEPEQLT